MIVPATSVKTLMCVQLIQKFRVQIIPVFLCAGFHHIPMTRNQSIKIPFGNNFSISPHHPQISNLSATGSLRLVLGKPMQKQEIMKPIMG